MMPETSEPCRALPVALVEVHHLSLDLFGALGGDDDGELRAAGIARANLLGHLLDREGNLGDEDDIRAARDARVESNPTSVAPHHFENHHAVVRLGRRVQTVERLGGDVERGHEAEGQLGGGEVVVDGLRHTDDREAPAVELARDGERALAADGDEGVDAKSREIVEGLFVDLFGLHGSPVLLPDDAAAAVARGPKSPGAREQPTHMLGLQLAHTRRAQKPFEAVLNADDAHAVLADGRLHRRPNHSVQPRRIAPAGHDSDGLHKSPESEVWSLESEARSMRALLSCLQTPDSGLIPVLYSSLSSARTARRIRGIRV